MVDVNPAAVPILVQYQECSATGAQARLAFETCGGNKRVNFSCTNLQRACRQGSKCPANARRQ
jgi:hypothetical protein